MSLLTGFVALTIVGLALLWFRKLIFSAGSLVSSKLFEEYAKKFDGDTTDDSRNKIYAEVVNSYYDLATDFYEYGWGGSFHFGRRYKNEALDRSLARHEMWLAHKMGLKSGDRVLDLGCGVGGPMREIARFSGASIVGVNNNQYQINKGKLYLKQQGLEDICSFIKADFMELPVKDGEFSHAYQIEATCHAPDRVACYKEIFRSIRPGGYFSGYEWCLTDKFDASNTEHQKIRDSILIGNGLPGLITCAEVLKALTAAGFEIIESEDIAAPTSHNPVPWYQPLSPSFSYEGFRLTKIGRTVTTLLVKALEFLHLAPKGSVNTQLTLIRGSDGLVASGKLGIFTPMMFYLARKPVAA